MKKIFMILGTCLMAALVVISCSKPNNSGKNNGKEDEKENEKEGNEPEANTVEIVIDGDFSDWDQITAEAAAKDEFIDIKKASDNDSPIKVIKAASDKDNVYIYAEVEKSSLAHSAICGEWGSSMDGVEGFRGDAANDPVSEEEIAFNLFFDPDANPETGFLTYVDEEENPLIPGLGCEQASQNLFFWNLTTSKVGCAWSQTNVGPVKYREDAESEWLPYDYNGDYFQQDNWDSENIFHRYGWQNDGYSDAGVAIDGGADGTGDNIAPAQGNLASKLVGEIVYIEFSIGKDDLVNYKSSFTEYAWGVCYNAVVKDGEDISYELWSIGPVSASYVK